MRASKQRHLLWKSMTFVKRQHVLLRLMFLLVLIFFSLFAASSSSFFFFPEFDFLHFSFTLGCFIPVCNVCLPQCRSLFKEPKELDFLIRGVARIFQREAHQPWIADDIWFIPVLSLVYPRAQSNYHGMKAHIN